jgi:hypothetical protein
VYGAAVRAAVLSVLIACGARLPALPSQGGPAWIELRSPHFQLWTDADEPRARELVQQMEHFRSIIYGVAFPELPPGGVTFVIAPLHREAQMYMGPEALAFSVDPHASPLGQPFIVMPGDAWGDERVVAHELTHAISFNALHHQPRWFLEGMATYFETVALDIKRKTVDVGTPPLVLEAVRHAGIRSVSHMLTCWRCGNLQIFYATAWTMYAYLRNNEPKRLAQLEQLFQEMPSDRAWAKIFPDHPIGDFGYELNQWLRVGDLKIWSYTIELQEWPVVQRTLGDADVAAVRAMLLPSRSDSAQLAQTALALDATNVLANIVEQKRHKAQLTSELAGRIAAAHPDQWLAWQMVRDSATTAEDRKAAEDKMCKLVLENRALATYAACAARIPASPDQPP